MNTHLQVSDDQKKTLTLDGDLDLLEELLVTIRATRNNEHNLVPVKEPKPIITTAQRSEQPTTPAVLSPVAQCLRIAAARGQALRLAREQAGLSAAEDSTQASSA